MKNLRGFLIVGILFLWINPLTAYGRNGVRLPRTALQLLNGTVIHLPGCENCHPNCLPKCGTRRFRRCCYFYMKKKKRELADDSDDDDDKYFPSTSVDDSILQRS